MARPATLYDRDFARWTQEQAELMRARRLAELDLENLIDEIETLGRSVRREIASRLLVLLIHLLKWRFQPEARSGGWRGTILEQRRRIHRELGENPSLKAYPAEILAEEYDIARLKAAGETDLPEGRFPRTCPFTLADILDTNFLPEAG